ncbi:uncharacterized protein PHACADRAFT_183382 [Phanerochaete carnosa HHB-10118-sp]|uniref:Uncharacterized protein n=1 Tax=Phanerochaete carnosa (strain HHB-10118-sp) TaxID=650164 RepID=K5V2P8_PHACS|nr:uncharacterized protein PHACADRAFT_183382 [Phanerochaete carnosa HHB-10118-sp]EKM56796.1 hypothetical protein PHACADRAFT_183382 [Phanerochaete carnosa HHB-10118-sp]
MPTNFVSYAVYFPMASLYSNSLLASFNMRDFLGNKEESSTYALSAVSPVTYSRSQQRDSSARVSKTCSPGHLESTGGMVFHIATEQSKSSTMADYAGSSLCYPMQFTSRLLAPLRSVVLDDEIDNSTGLSVYFPTANRMSGSHNLPHALTCRALQGEVLTLRPPPMEPSAHWHRAYVLLRDTDSDDGDLVTHVQIVKSIVTLWGFADGMRVALFLAYTDVTTTLRVGRGWKCHRVESKWADVRSTGPAKAIPLLERVSITPALAVHRAVQGLAAIIVLPAALICCSPNRRLEPCRSTRRVSA